MEPTYGGWLSLAALALVPLIGFIHRIHFEDVALTLPVLRRGVLVEHNLAHQRVADLLARAQARDEARSIEHRQVLHDRLASDWQLTLQQCCRSGASLSHQAQHPTAGRICQCGEDRIGSLVQHSLIHGAALRAQPCLSPEATTRMHAATEGNHFGAGTVLTASTSFWSYATWRP